MNAKYSELNKRQKFISSKPQTLRYSRSKKAEYTCSLNSTHRTRNFQPKNVEREREQKNTKS